MGEKIPIVCCYIPGSSFLARGAGAAWRNVWGVQKTTPVRPQGSNSTLWKDVGMKCPL